MKSFATTFNNAEVGNSISIFSEHHDGRGGYFTSTARGTVLKVNKRTIRVLSAKNNLEYLVDIHGTWKLAK